MRENAWLHQYGRALRIAHSARADSRDAGHGQRRAVSGITSAGMCLAMLTAMMSLPGAVWAQSGADGVFEIPVHPEAPTVVYLPDEITRARVTGGSIQVTLAGRTMHLRPRSGVPAGLKALLEVETMTMLLTFRLHVVERWRDARSELLVVAMASERRAEEGPIAAQHALRFDTGAGKHGPGHANALAPPRAEPPAAPEPAMDVEQVARPEVAPRAPQVEPRPLEISVQAVAGLPGMTAQHVAGYESGDARQTQLTFGARMSGARPGNWWAVEAGISAELPLQPTVHAREISRGLDEMLELGGPWLRMDVGLRAHFGTRWRPTMHIGIGLQAHFRNARGFLRVDQPPPAAAIEIPMAPRRDMPLGGVLVFGLGFEHRRGDMLLGIELQVRQAVPAEYRSVGVLLSAGYLLDQGE